MIDEPVGRLYVDANIFIRMFEGADDLSAALSDLFLLDSESAEVPQLATSELTLAEVLVVPSREGNEKLIDVYDIWTRSNAYLEVRPIDRDVLWYAAHLRSQYSSLKLPDAIHVSTAIGMKCSHFLSADKRLGGRYELTNRRYGMVSGSAIIDVIRPEISTINQITQALRR